MLPKTNFTHRLKVKNWKKDTPCKWKPKMSRRCCTYMKYNRYQNCRHRQRRTLYVQDKFNNTMQQS